MWSFVLSTILVLQGFTPSHQAEKLQEMKCGNGVGCIGHPVGCDPGPSASKEKKCIVVFKYTDASEFVQMYIEGQKMDNDRVNEYAAVGFSKDKTMGDDAVTTCLQDGSVVISYNPEHSNRPITDNKVYKETIIPQSSGSEDRRYWCTFLQIKVPKEDTTEIFNLVERDYHILLAVGRAKLSEKKMKAHALIRHSRRYPSVTAEMYSFKGKEHIKPVPTAKPEPAPKPTHELGSELTCTSGVVKGGKVQGALSCQGHWCYLKAPSSSWRNAMAKQGEMGCDPGAICQKDGCFVSHPIANERHCCCKAWSFCSDDFLDESDSSAPLSFRSFSVLAMVLSSVILCAWLR